MTILLSLLTIQLFIYCLQLEIVKFDVSLVAKILLFNMSISTLFFSQKWLLVKKELAG